MIDDPLAFIRAETRLRPVPLVPEIRLHLADEATELWQRTEDELGAIGLPPPFWAFAWAGGQALARYVLDRPGLVAGRTVLDVASGSGLVAIAAALAGARAVTAADIDPFAAAACRLNAAANGLRCGSSLSPPLPSGEGSSKRSFEPAWGRVGRAGPTPVGFADSALPCRGGIGAAAIEAATADLVGLDQDWDVVLAGDIFYERDVAARMGAWLPHLQARGATVLVGDPGRSYLPQDRMEELARFSVPVTRSLEDAEIKLTRVWRFR